MKLVLPILVSFICLTACNTKTENRFATIKPAEDVAPEVKEMAIMPEIVKAPVAIVFEGGKGSPFPGANGVQAKAMWRAYLCLPANTESETGSITLDLEKWGTPYFAKSTDAAGNILSVDKLTRVTLNYSHKTTLVGPPEKNYGVSYGQTHFKSESVGDWVEMVTAKTPRDYQNEAAIFNLDYTTGTLGSVSYTLIGGQYISVTLMRFTYNSAEVRVIAECEKSETGFVVQTDLNE